MLVFHEPGPEYSINTMTNDSCLLHQANTWPADLNMGDESSCVFPDCNEKLSASLLAGNQREKPFDG